VKNILDEIEQKYPVDTILVNGEQIWPYLRIAYWSAYIRRMTSQSGQAQLSLPVLKRLMKMLRNGPYGLTSWFGKYDYIALSDTSERKNIHGKYFNKLLDPIIDELGTHRVLYVEIPAPSLYPAKRVHTTRIVCHDLLTLLALTLQMLTRRKYKIQNESTLKTVQKEYGLRVNDGRQVGFFNAKRRVFGLLFRKIKPKAILLSDYYGSNFPAVKAAKDLGITVIELQHGVIGKEHPAYNLGIELDKCYFPDYLLALGRNEIETFSNSRFIEPKNVFPVGSFYIEYIRENHKAEPDLVEQLRDYNRSVAVTLDWIMEKPAIDFVHQAANLDRTVFYLLVPRRPQEKHYSALSLPENVTLIRDKNFYELMAYVDFHSTVFSTCALEAPSLGVQNILINIDNLSRQYYGAVLNDSRITRYADTPRELVDTIAGFEKLDRGTIVEFNEHIIATDYKGNIHSFIARYLR
jgi:hypothetical protein